MAYCSAAHGVRGDRVRTLIGLTALGGLMAWAGGWGAGGRVAKQKGMKTQVGVQPMASFVWNTPNDLCVLLGIHLSLYGTTVLGSSKASIAMVLGITMGLGIGQGWADTSPLPSFFNG